jgi:hypothetical protein
MKDNKTDIVRIHDDATAGTVAAQEMSGGNQPDGGSAQADSSANMKDPSIYGGDKPIDLKFPLCFDDIWFGYIVFPMVVLMFIVFSCGGWVSIFKQLFSGDQVDWAGLLVNLLMCVLFGIGIVWFAYSWFVDYYRKRARSIDIDPATKTFHVRNFVLTRGKHCRPAFYPELTFTLDDVRKVYFQRSAASPLLVVDSGFYIVIPEGYLYVYGKTNEFLRMKYFLLIEAEGKNEAKRYITLDGVFRAFLYRDEVLGTSKN